MIHSGDYLTPYYCTGAMRFNKPILTYWFMTASYGGLGIDFLSSRLPFLLAGCLTLWVTFRTSLALFHNRGEALLAAVVLASNFQFIAEATRSTPDILLTLFMSVSLYGFINLIFNKEFTKANYAFAYLGAALAIETKGTLGIFPVLFSLAFCAVRRGDSVRPLRLIHPVITAVSALVAVSWFAVVLFEHGSPALRLFFMDQVGTRVSGSSFKIIGNMASFVWAAVRHFFPWSLMVLGGVLWNRDVLRDFFRRHRGECLFVIGWYVLVFLLFSGSNIRRTRYLLPTYPMISILVSVLLARIMEEKPFSGLLDRMMPRLMLGVGAVCAAALGVSGSVFDLRLAIAGAVLFFGVVVLYFTLLRRGRFLLLSGVGLCIILSVSVAGVLVKPVFGTLPFGEMIERILKIEHGQKRVRVAILGNTIKLATAITVMSGGRIEAVALMEDKTSHIPEGFNALIVSDKDRDRLDPAVYRVEECGYEYRNRDSDPADIWNSLKSADLRSVFVQRKEPLYLVTIP